MAENIGISSFIATVALVSIHLLVNKLNLSFIPRSKGLSFSGGVSITYIFIHILPELQKRQELLEKVEFIPAFIESHIYLVALAGLTIFYGIGRAAKHSKESFRGAASGENEGNPNVFWIHIFSFSVYNFLIGYLLTSEAKISASQLALFSIAMAFHFTVTDYALADHYRTAYRKRGRWIVVFSLMAGWGVSIIKELPETYLTIVFAFISGGVILNVLTEEIPEERKSNFWAFLTGVVFYTLLLLTL